jgi:hypothetical protein
MPVTFRLSRCEDKERDDVIIIRERLNAPGFVVRYVDADAPRRVWISEKSYTELIIYIERIFAGLNDIDSFVALQIDIPAYPLVFHKVSTLTPATQQRILESVREWAVNPPSSFFQ